MFWWVAGGVVLLALLGLVAVLGALRWRLAELDRVAALARERAAQAQALQTSAAGVQPTLAGVQARATAVQHRLAARRGR